MIVVEDLLAHFKMKIDEKKKLEIDFLLEEMENILAHVKIGRRRKVQRISHACIQFNQSATRNKLEMKQFIENWQRRTPLPLNYPPNDPIKYFLALLMLLQRFLSLVLSLSPQNRFIFVCAHRENLLFLLLLWSRWCRIVRIFSVIIFVSNQAEPNFFMQFLIFKPFEFSLEA